MSGCSDYWCEHYGKGRSNCDHCVKKETTKDKAELQVILKRHAVKAMEISENQEKNKGQLR